MQSIYADAYLSNSDWSFSLPKDNVHMSEIFEDKMFAF